ncbi:MAG: hypothetical protein AAGD00_07540 [Planctomycetota bacterium]
MSDHTMQPERAAAMDAERPVITGARTCVGCGYDLRGLREGDQCPECGRVIALDLVRRMGYLGEASRAYLYTMLLGFALTFVGMIGVFLRMVTVPKLGVQHAIDLGTFVVYTGFIAAWLLGTWIVLRDRPEDLRRAEGDGQRAPREHVWLRRTILLMELAWVPAIVLDYVSGLSAAGNSAGLIRIASFSLYVVGAGGLLPLSFYLGVIATWARDSGIAIRLQSMGWVMSAAGVCLVLLGVWSAIGGLAFLWFFAMLLAGGAWLVSAFVMLWTVLEMFNMVRWTLINKAGAEQRDERRTERAMRERAQHQAHVAAAPPEPIPEPEQTLLMNELLDPEPESGADEPDRVWRSSAEHYVERGEDQDPYKIEGE